MSRFFFLCVWISPNWKVGWGITLMDELLCRVWLVESAKSAKSGDCWWSWEFEEAAIPFLSFFFFFGVLLFTCYELWCVVFHVVWWRCFRVVRRMMVHLIGVEDKSLMIKEGKHFDSSFCDSDSCESWWWCANFWEECLRLEIGCFVN